MKAKPENGDEMMDRIPEFPGQTPFLRLNLRNIQKVLEQVWLENDALKAKPADAVLGYDKDPAGMTSGSIVARGWCYTTALLIRKLFGGEVVKGKLRGEPHYWNRLKYEFDLTSRHGGDAFAPATKGETLRHIPASEDAHIQILLQSFMARQEVMKLSLLTEPVFYKTYDPNELGFADGANTVKMKTAHSTRSLPLPTLSSRDYAPSIFNLLEKLSPGVCWITLTEKQLECLFNRPMIYFNLLFELQSIATTCKNLKETIETLFKDVFAGEAAIEKVKAERDVLLRCSTFDLSFKTNTAIKVPDGYLVRLGIYRYCLVNKTGKPHSLQLGTGLDHIKRLYEYAKCWEPISTGCLRAFRGSRRDYCVIASAVGRYEPVLATVLAP